MAETPQPKIVHKLALRTLFALLGLGAVVWGIRAWQDFSRDPERFGAVDSADMIAAVEMLDNGQQVVAFDRSGKQLRSPDYRPGNTERDVAWSPNGNRLYYVSDRENGIFQVFRWRPVDGGKSEPRTVTTRGKSNPTFPPVKESDDTLLMTSGGVVLSLDPILKRTTQVLPPITGAIAMESDDEGGGSTSQFAGVYGRLGESFRIARTIPGHNAVAAIMRRDQTEVLIVQPLWAAGEKAKPPIPLAEGDRIDFVVSSNGTLVFTVQNFYWPPLLPIPDQFKKNGRITTPFEHFVGFYRPGEDTTFRIIAASPNNEAAFGSPSVSPDGTRVLVTSGPYDETGMRSGGLILMPVADNSASSAVGLLEGEVFEPSWHPDGKRIVFIRRQDGKRRIVTCRDDGSEEKVVGPDSNFAFPSFSPQVKTGE